MQLRIQPNIMRVYLVCVGCTLKAVRFKIALHSFYESPLPRSSGQTALCARVEYIGNAKTRDL
jgi:hypothetical protein